MRHEVANEVYSILVDHCGASDDWHGRGLFILAHLDDNPHPPMEWRFQGSLGFGGKFWSADMRVSCYREDETTKRLASIAAADAALAELAASP